MKKYIFYHSNQVITRFIPRAKVGCLAVGTNKGRTVHAILPKAAKCGRRANTIAKSVCSQAIRTREVLGCNDCCTPHYASAIIEAPTFTFAARANMKRTQCKPLIDTAVCE
jgi:hypothetical protein